MSREIRRVPENWEHPKKENGHYQPMFDKTYWQRVIGHLRYELPWYLWPVKNLQHIREWLKGLPDRAYCRPRFRKGTATHYQIYEDVSEGTPVSPIFATLDELKEWLIGEGYSREAAEGFAKDGWVPSLVITEGRMYANFECAALPRSE